MAIDWDKPIRRKKDGWPARLICSDINFIRRRAVAVSNPKQDEFILLYDEDGKDIFPEYDLENCPEPQSESSESLNQMTFPGLGLDASSSLLRHAFIQEETRRLNEKARKIRQGTFDLHAQESDLLWRERNLETLSKSFGLRGVFLEAHAALVATADHNQDNAEACTRAIKALSVERKALREQINTEQPHEQT